MKASELREEITKLLSQHGDCDIVIINPYCEPAVLDPSKIYFESSDFSSPVFQILGE